MVKGIKSQTSATLSPLIDHIPLIFTPLSDKIEIREKSLKQYVVLDVTCKSQYNFQQICGKSRAVDRSL